MDRHKILKHIEDYGFVVSDLKDNHLKSYHCINNLSNSEFILACVNDDLNVVNISEKSIPIVYLIEVKDRINEVIKLVESDEHKDKIFLIYDEEEEIEFFLKDLWNIIIELNR
ncbi:hypothetical protein [Alkalithermobacter paradoxus]|uniref:Uncharacterized protein n=1 Tax=Alkalithermobacter paradoxus TaxID=29349 RepID=A0A1V4I9E5_9FIRM|nr:hypothetical protein CLOTH_06390 [[Clostridium] thermoalcaliphilum]